MNKNCDDLNPFSGALFDVEHALNIYATSYSTFAAEALYNEQFLKTISQADRAFHIYLIGFSPKIEIDNPRFENSSLTLTVSCIGKKSELIFDIPQEFKFIQTKDQCYLEDQDGQPRWPNQEHIIQKLSDAVDGLPFHVKYIGQSYGEDGSRDALDRLLKHETLQKIAIKGIPDDQVLQVILLELLPANRVLTAFLPNAENRDDDETRRQNGVDKLFDTTEAERISLYEASLIRYFSPEFNKEFKNSFPSTHLKILQDCYKKDFLAVTAEINFDNFPFRLFSEKVPKSYYHIITHDLQNQENRRMFFVM